MHFGPHGIFGSNTSKSCRYIGSAVFSYCNKSPFGGHCKVTLHRDTSKVKLEYQSVGLGTNPREVLLQSVQVLASCLLLLCDGLESCDKLDLLCFHNALLIAM